MTRFHMRYDKRHAQIHNKYLQQQRHFMQLTGVELLQELQQLAEQNIAINYEAPPGLVVDYALPDNEQNEESLLVRLQARLDAMVDGQSKLMTVLLHFLDSDGFLRTPLKEIQQWLRTEAIFVNRTATVTMTELEQALLVLQTLGPAGMAARTLQECWILQLKSLLAEDSRAALALRLCQEHWVELTKRQYKTIKRALMISQIQMNELLTYLRNLHTGIEMQAQDERMFHVIPDILLARRHGKWHAYLNEQLMPTVTLTQAPCERADIAEAEQVLGNLAYRYENLLRLAQAMVSHQQVWLDKGKGYLKYLTLDMLADELSLHTSTISRLCSQKYIHTPFGTFALAELLSTAATQIKPINQFSFVSSPQKQSRVSERLEPKVISVDQTQLRLRELVSSETVTEPYTDEQLSQLLAEEGMRISRRTVSKYRDALGIPSSYQRKFKNS